jgi:hypothetical protein
VRRWLETIFAVAAVLACALGAMIVNFEEPEPQCPQLPGFVLTLCVGNELTNH